MITELFGVPLGLDASILTQGLLNIGVAGIHTLGTSTADCRISVKFNAAFSFRAENASNYGFHFGISPTAPDAIFSNNAGIERFRIGDGGLAAVKTNRTSGVNVSIVDLWDSVTGVQAPGYGVYLMLSQRRRPTVSNSFRGWWWWDKQ